MKKLIFLIFIALCAFRAMAQTFEWNAKFDVIADNREFSTRYGFPQTIIGARLKPEVGFAFDQNNRVMLGASYFLLAGDSSFSQPILPVAYYHYRNSGFDFYAGFTPKMYQKNSFPLAVYTDSLYYFAPINQGFVANYENSWGDFSVSQSGLFDFFVNYNYGANEEFIAGFMGNVRWKWLQINEWYYYQHQRPAEYIAAGRPITDNGCAGITGGVNVQERLFSVEAQAGVLSSWRRTRPAAHNNSAGFFADGTVSFKRIIGMQVTHYNGDGIFLPLADPLYRSGNYTRFSFQINPLNRVKTLNNYCAMNFRFNWHRVAGEWNTSQQMFLTVNIDQIEKQTKTPNLPVGEM
ncbi:MAG: hypothetical protein LBU90_09270 [Bacteroidales bacterium]|jgi:hypothetical protein|nr:hypothetical protein [Bacteroidales bacterium]